MRQRLIALKDEEFYKIMGNNCPWVTNDQSIVPKLTFFFGDAVPNDSTYQRRCFQFSYTVDGEKRAVSTRLTFDRTIPIMSLSSKCPKREDPPSWVKRTNVIKTGVFVGGPSGFAEKLLARMYILMPASGYQGSDHPSVDLRLVGLGIFKGDGRNWVKPFRLRSCFSVDLSWESWTDHILQVGGAILKETKIFDAVRAFRQTVVFADEAFMAMLESFLPQTNTFIVTNGEIGFSLKELSTITGLPILSKLYEEFIPIDSVLEEQSEEFKLLYFQLIAFYDFLKEKEGSKVWCSSWRSGSFLSSNFFDSGESSKSTTQEAKAKNPNLKKISAMRENLKEFFTNTYAIHSNIALRRGPVFYLTYWLGEAVFAGGDGTHIRPHCIFPACQMAFGERLALVPALYSYFCTELQAATFLVRLGLAMNRVFSTHILYSWYVYHCPSFHQLDIALDDDPFMIQLAKGKPVSESLLFARLRIRRFWDIEMGQSSVKLSPGLRNKAFDFRVSLDSTRAGSERHYSLTNAKKAWLFNIRLGFSQGVVGAPSSKVKHFGGLHDGRNAWAFYSAEDTTAMIPYPELSTFRTAGFTKWFVESFSVYRGLSKKELDDVIRSGVAQKIPGEVLEQLAEEEAEVTAWIQAERAKASMESTGKSRPSGEDSSERPYFDGGAEASGDDDEPPEKRSRGGKISSDEDDDLMMPEVPADEVVTDPIVASEEEPKDSEVDPESPPTNLPEDSDDFEPSMDAIFYDASNELMEAKNIPPIVKEGCEVTGEVPLSFSEPEQWVPTADPRVGASSTSFDEAEKSLRADIPSPVAPIGKSFLITLPMVHDMGSQPTEHGECSSEPSRQFANKDILVDSEEVGLDITNAKPFVDEVIALANKWIETKSFPNDDFFNEMFLKPSGKVKYELNEISRTRKQLVRERNVTELAIIELTQDQHRLDREVIEARQRLELLEEQAAAKWTAISKARDRERTLIRQVEEAESNLRRKTQEYEQWQIL
ncbi:hypothetical protein AAC387_Pa09g0898 [Persea americana]